MDDKFASDKVFENLVVKFNYYCEDQRLFRYLELIYGSPPCETMIGSNLLLSGIDVALMDMHEGERRQLALLPAAAFGEWSEELLQEIPSEEIPVESRRAGAEFLVVNSQEDAVPVRVDHYASDVATVDFNHPMAGETVQVELLLISRTLREG